MNGTWQFIPGSVAALLYVRTPETTGESQAVVFMSFEKGVVTGRRDTPLAETGWPAEVQKSINEHFEHVFSLEHEGRSDMSKPSPRAVFMEAAKPWTITIEEN
jgi:hypothetical protein